MRAGSTAGARARARARPGMARVLLLAALLAARAAALALPTGDPVVFEAAFQGRCGAGSPCEQLCRELHDGTYECGCAHGYALHVNGYECQELNATSKSSDTVTDTEEDVLYQKDVSFSAELEVAQPSTRLSKKAKENLNVEGRQQKNAPHISNYKNDNYTYSGERFKEIDGLKSLMSEGVSENDINMISDDKRDDEYGVGARDELKVTTQGPSLEQKVPGATVSPPWTAAVAECDCAHCQDNATPKCGSELSTPRFSGNSWLALRALRGAYKRVRLRVRVRPERARGILLLTGERDDLTGDYLAIVLRQGHVELRFDCGSGAGVLRSPEPVRLGRWNTIAVYRHRWDAWLKLNNGKRVRGRSKGLFSRMTFREPVWVGGGGNTTGLISKLGLSDGLLGCVDSLKINGDSYRLPADAVAANDVGECAPTLAPWKAKELSTTSEAILDRQENHALYDINDIVHFEDNDVVMRDSRVEVTEANNNDLDNSIEQFKRDDDIKVNDVRSHRLESKYGVRSKSNDADSKVITEVSNELTSNKSKEDDCECEHGGGCVADVCLCPLGYAGVKCEVTLDLKVPRFNGSSYLRLPGLGYTASSWLHIEITLRPTSGDGLVLYDSDQVSGDGDFFSLHLREYYVEFAFDLGSGIALVRSAYPLVPDKWHRVTVSRSGRRATLRVQPMIDGIAVSPTTEYAEAIRSVTSRGSSRRLALRQPLLLGGAPRPLPSRLALQHCYSGCVGQLAINDEELSVVSSALGGVNVDNCDNPNNKTCRDGKPCSQNLEVLPSYVTNDTKYSIHHSIVAKKGFKQKHHRAKTKKHLIHLHTDKYAKKKKYYSKKNYYRQEVERSNEVVTNGPSYDGQTYMQIMNLDANEINWGDTNSYPSFTGKDSFIHIDDEETMKRLLSFSLDINVRFRSEKADGLLVWSGRTNMAAGDDFLSLGIENSVLVFRYDLGSGEVMIIANHTKVDDGLWHRARATRNRQAGVLEVDGLGSVGKISPGKLKQLNTENGLYIGGLPSIEISTLGKYKSGLVGCVSQISLSGDFDIPLSLSKLPHTITNNVGRCTP